MKIRELCLTAGLIGATALLLSVREHKTFEEKRVLLRGTVQGMLGTELVPQSVPKPRAFIGVQRQGDMLKATVQTSNLLAPGSVDVIYEAKHFARGYPYLLVNGKKVGRVEGGSHPLPSLGDGDHVVSVYFENDKGHLYRSFNQPIGDSILLHIEGMEFHTSPL